VVFKIESIYKKVSHERHRMTGLIRFKELKNNILYAEISPDYNVIGIVASHFIKRLSSENFIIHDKKRNIAVFYNKKEWIIKEVEGDLNIIFNEKEEDYQNLWKMYFKSISIKEKFNPKLQRSNMPKKYWKYLIEKGG
jgi:probable DNA metabolism protein